MSNQRSTFMKRQREMDLKDKARAKEARRAAKRDEVRTTKGPEIAWGDAVTFPPGQGPAPDPLPIDPSADGDDAADDGDSADSADDADAATPSSPPPPVAARPPTNGAARRR
jgi:hypothetical protein